MILHHLRLREIKKHQRMKLQIKVNQKNLSSQRRRRRPQLPKKNLKKLLQLKQLQFKLKVQLQLLLKVLVVHLTHTILSMT